MKTQKSPILFLYRNSKNIVIGRHQNPWKEIHMDRMQADQVQLCRRKSGGGAVYQDLGNSVFSFLLSGDSNTNFKAKNNSILMRALSVLGVQASVSGRNDLISNGKKISGSAYKMNQIGKKKQFLHHGTMLIDIDKEGVFKYLNPHKAKLQSKGIQSVASRIINLKEIQSEITHESFVQALKKSWLKDYPDSQISNLIEFPPQVEEIQKAYLDWNWRYGESPSFTHQLETRFEWGIIDIHCQVEQAVIQKCKVFSDCLEPEFVDSVQDVLLGKKYGREAAEAVRELKTWETWAEELSEWLIGNF